MKGLIGFLIVCSFAVSAHAVDVHASDKVSNEIPLAVETTKNSTRLFEDIFKEVFEMIRAFLKEGVEPIGSFDPLILDEIDLNGLKTSLINGDLYLSNVVVKGISDFVGDGGTPPLPVSVTMNLGIPALELTTDYTANLNLFGMIDLYGAGKINIVLSNFNLGLTVGVAVTNPPTLGTASVALQLPLTKAKITGLFNDEYMSDLVSKQLSDTLNTLAEEENERIKGILLDVLAEIIEKINKIITGEKNVNLKSKEFYRSILWSIVEAVKQIEIRDFFNKFN